MQRTVINADELDPKTEELLNESRCGRKDSPEHETPAFARRSKRWRKKRSIEFLTGVRWNRFPVSIGFKNYWGGLSSGQQEAAAIKCGRVSLQLAILKLALVKIRKSGTCFLLEDMGGTIWALV